jgi:hypothetical protein
MATGLWMIAIHFYAPRTSQPLDTVMSKHVSPAAMITTARPVLMARVELAEQR